VPLDPKACYRAVLARDARFDGVFFVGVRTTGIYCRPVCRAKTPGADRCSYFSHAALAERAGFRACFRCRPERAPGNGTDDLVSRMVAAAVARIEAGALQESSLEELSRELGVTSRHLRRCMQDELGVSPIELSLTRRLALARELLHGTSLSMTEVAFASGFGSVRRFNDAFRTRHGRTPTDLRRTARVPNDGHAASSVRVLLGYRAPFDWESLKAFLAARAVAGVEAVVDDSYVRTVRIGERRGWISVRPSRERALALSLEVAPSLLPVLMAVVAKTRRLFDLDARPSAIDKHLAVDPRLAHLVKERPGLRVPGAFEPFETAMAAVLGQQVTVGAGVTLASRLVAALGHDVDTPFPNVNRLWPTADRVASASEATLAKLGMPGARARSLAAVARAVVDGRLDLTRPLSPGALEESLLAIAGIGPWTAQYILMRAAAWPDAFPVGDVALAKALGMRDSTWRADTARAAEAWRPWRSYATLHLWTSLTGAPS
jgi:AraC family transcriptional regulator of adaptative response / DNA-3-methyladenine glycosylase II